MSDLHEYLNRLGPAHPPHTVLRFVPTLPACHVIVPSDINSNQKASRLNDASMARAALTILA